MNVSRLYIFTLHSNKKIPAIPLEELQVFFYGG